MQNTLTGRIAVQHPLVVTNSLEHAINATATATAQQMSSGTITSTSAAAVAITTPTAASIYSYLGLPLGSYYDFVIDNTAGSNTVTVTLDGSIAAESVLTGGTTLTVAAGHYGRFSLYFYSATAAKISRIA